MNISGKRQVHGTPWPKGRRSATLLERSPASKYLNTIVRFNEAIGPMLVWSRRFVWNELGLTGLDKLFRIIGVAVLGLLETGVLNNTQNGVIRCSLLRRKRRHHSTPESVPGARQTW